MSPAPMVPETTARTEQIPTVVITPVKPCFQGPYDDICNNTKPLRTILNERRTQLNYTQVQVARAMNIRSSEFIGMVEGGHRNFELNKIPRLAEVLQLDVESLCRRALFEAAPQFAMSVFGTKLRTFVPRNAQAKIPAQSVIMDARQAEYNQKLYALPSALRHQILMQIDQYTTLINDGPSRLRPALAMPIEPMAMAMAAGSGAEDLSQELWGGTNDRTF